MPWLIATFRNVARIQWDIIYIAIYSGQVESLTKQMAKKATVWKRGKVVIDVRKAIKTTLLAFSSRVQSLYRPQRRFGHFSNYNPRVVTIKGSV